jgi:bifunctional DNase/RNase
MTTSYPVAFVTALLVVGAGCSKKEGPPELAISSGTNQEGATNAGPGASSEKPASPPEANGNGASAAIPNGYVKMSVGGVAPTSAGEAVLLVDSVSNVAIPIFIGGTEALSIQLRLEKRDFVRPLTHDLYDETLKKLGGRVESVRVDRLQDNTYYGTVVLKTTSNRVELDARPSDAIALAIGNHAPIHVARKVVDAAGIKLDQLPQAKRPAESLPIEPGDKRPEPVSL